MENSMWANGNTSSISMNIIDPDESSFVVLTESEHDIVILPSSPTSPSAILKKNNMLNITEIPKIRLDDKELVIMAHLTQLEESNNDPNHENNVNIAEDSKIEGYLEMSDDKEVYHQPDITPPNSLSSMLSELDASDPSSVTEEFVHSPRLSPNTPIVTNEEGMLDKSLGTVNQSVISEEITLDTQSSQLTSIIPGNNPLRGSTMGIVIEELHNLSIVEEEDEFQDISLGGDTPNKKVNKREYEGATYYEMESCMWCFSQPLSYLWESLWENTKPETSNPNSTSKSTAVHSLRI